MALQAFWPLVAQAKPANALVPVCTVEGVTHYLEVPLPAEHKSTGHQHCAFCVFGSALPGHDGAAVGVFDPVSHVYDYFASSAPDTDFFAPGDARAPPVLPMVDVDDNHYGRTSETNSALRRTGGAASTEHRGGIVRLGLLHR